MPFALFDWLSGLLRDGPDQLPSLPSCIEAVDAPNAAVTYHGMAHDGLMMVTEAANAARATRRSVEACIDRRTLVDLRNDFLVATVALQDELQALEPRMACVRAAARALRELFVHRQEEQMGVRAGWPNPQVPTSLGTRHTVRWSRSGMARAVRDLALVPDDPVQGAPRVATAHLDITRLDAAELSLLERLARPQFDGDGEVPRWQLGQILGQWLHSTAHDRSLDAALLAVRAGRDAAHDALARTRALPHDEELPADATDVWRDLEGAAAQLEEVVAAWESAVGRLGNGMEAIDRVATWSITPNVEPDADYLREARQAYELLFPGSSLRW